MAFDYRSLMSGERRDPLAYLMRAALRAASVAYRIGVNHRNGGFETGRRDIHRCGVPVISVGNLTTGGTGKTPIVCYLAKALRQRGIRVAIVSRGYGREERDANDEAMELHDRLPDVPHLQDPDRVEAARVAVEELESEVILMDDGFQHRRLHRDLDIVVIDATCPFGFGYLLPRGLLREPSTGLRRADLVIITRCDVVDQATISQIESSVRENNADVPIVHSCHTPTTLLTFPADSEPSENLRGQEVAVLCAIGNPGALEQTVKGCGANIVDTKSLPDHDPYAPETVKQLRDWAGSLGGNASRIVCTHKDLVKLRTDRLGGIPLQALLIDLTVTKGDEVLEKLITEVIKTE